MRAMILFILINNISFRLIQDRRNDFRRGGGTDGWVEHWWLNKTIVKRACTWGLVHPLHPVPTAMLYLIRLKSDKWAQAPLNAFFSF